MDPKKESRISTCALYNSISARGMGMTESTGGFVASEKRQVEPMRSKPLCVYLSSLQKEVHGRPQLKNSQMTPCAYRWHKTYYKKERHKGELQLGMKVNSAGSVWTNPWKQKAIKTAQFMPTTNRW